MARRPLLLIPILALAAACAPVPQRVGAPATWYPSPNFDARRPNLVVIHHTTNATAEQALRTLTDPAREVSAHYLVDREGKVYQLVDERSRAWHAGLSRWGGNADVNSASIGIELDNSGAEPFAEAQVQALLALLADIKSRYRIPTANFVGHADVAPGRKVDPSRLFPWRALALAGFGLWCDAPLPEPPAGFDAILALQAFGYDVSDPIAAARAFNLHFMGVDDDPNLGPAAQAMLSCLAEKAGNGAER